MEASLIRRKINKLVEISGCMKFQLEIFLLLVKKLIVAFLVFYSILCYSDFNSNDRHFSYFQVVKYHFGTSISKYYP